MAFRAAGAFLPLGEGAPVRTLGRMRISPGVAGKPFFARLAAWFISCGMIATGNHIDFEFAAGCFTLISHQNRFRRADFGASVCFGILATGKDGIQIASLSPGEAKGRHSRPGRPKGGPILHRETVIPRLFGFETPPGGGRWRQSHRFAPAGRRSPPGAGTSIWGPLPG